MSTTNDIKGIVDIGWVEHGREFTILGKQIVVNGMEWTPIVYDDEEDPTFIKSAAIKIIEILTSEQWYKKTYPDKEVTILDPDGWDRSNWDYSWAEEKVSYKEFNSRLANSTVSVIKKPLQQRENP